jgi:hypothetical protein
VVQHDCYTTYTAGIDQIDSPDRARYTTTTRVTVLPVARQNGGTFHWKKPQPTAKSERHGTVRRGLCCPCVLRREGHTLWPLRTGHGAAATPCLPARQRPNSLAALGLHEVHAKANGFCNFVFFKQSHVLRCGLRQSCSSQYVV